MSMLDWARREVELAKKFERGGEEDNGEWDYGCACYDSAMKAYELLSEEGHSGYSWSITKNILMRLMEGKPLRPIIDEDFKNGNDCTYYPTCYLKDGIVSEKQCPRMSSLFRTEYDDGTVKYRDIDRVIGIDIDKSYTYGGGGISKYVDDMFPITMPYYPGSKPYKVYTDDFASNGKRGCYDYKAFLYIETPEGEKIDIGEYFYYAENNKTIQISKEEYETAKEMAKKI